MYDPSFLGVFGRLRQQEMLADADRRHARRRAKVNRADWREQRAERRHWYSPTSWRSAARFRREPFESNLQHDLGISTRVGCVGKENSNPASDNNPGHAEVVEVIFDPGQTWDILELLSRSTSPTPGNQFSPKPCAAVSRLVDGGDQGLPSSGSVPHARGGATPGDLCRHPGGSRGLPCHE